MNKPSKTSMGHAEAGELLPWLVNGTLGSREHSAVARHVENCPACTTDVKILRKVQGAITQNDPAPLVPKPDFQTLSARMDESPSNRRRPLQVWLAAAAAGLAAAWLLMGVFGETKIESNSNTFETATSETTATEMDYVVEVRFTYGASPSERERVIGSLNASSVADVPGENAVRATVRLAVTTLDDLNDQVREIENAAIVQSVSVVAVQIPVRQNP